MKNYDIAAYIWPAYTGDEARTSIFWPQGFGEWETVMAAEPLFPNHYQPRRPLWGYQNEADPYVMEMQIEAASRHGINVFIYDWYWYDGRPFLEQCLNNGFLKAKNRSKMKFYLMWANHDVTYGWDRRISDSDYDTVIWKGSVSCEQFRSIGKTWIEKYFSLPEYYKIDNKPVLSIYCLQNLIDGLGGIENTIKELNLLNDEAVKNGFDGIHYQYVKYGTIETNLTGFDGVKGVYDPAEIIKLLPFSSLTHYQFIHFSNVNRKYADIMKDVEKEWDSIDKNYHIKYFPHISIGWDNTPRYKTHTNLITKENTPAEFEKALLSAKNYADRHGVNLVTINSWNEWTEGSYLMPDKLYGYQYLEAVKRVFKSD